VGVIERRGQLLQGLLARRPAQQSKPAELPDRVIEIRVGAFDRLVRLADLLLARRPSVRVDHSRVRSDRDPHVPQRNTPRRANSRSDLA
jgi:hypothetical protein